MRSPEQFDAFYKEARDRLLLQTYCLTGDLLAARRAVRDAFIVASHRWRKVSQLDDPESAVRPHAWRLAQRRHTGRVWHREKDLPDDVRATLDALGKLTIVQRKAVLLTQTATVTMPQMAREIGVPLEVAERELQLGAAQLSLQLELPSAALPTLLEPVAEVAIDRVRWPRPTIIRRAGAARRRTHTVAGVVAAGACVLAAGALVTDSGGVRPTLRPHDGRVATSALTRPPMATLDATLLGAPALDARLTRTAWTVVGTDTDPSDNVPQLTCQRQAAADPRGVSALVRAFGPASGSKGGSGDSGDSGGTGGSGGESDRASGQPQAVQMTELSRRDPAAERTFTRTVGWFAGCQATQVQLVGTRTPVGVGEESVLLELRSWSPPVRTISVAVARSGRFTTSIYVDTPGIRGPRPQVMGGLLADAVDGLCEVDGAGTCGAGSGAGSTRTPKVVDREPVPTGKVPALLAAVDLPPLRGVDAGWVATSPVPPTDGMTLTPCAPETFRGGFQGARFSRASERSYVIPDAGLPDQFGLTETVAALPRARARAFLAEARRRMAQCADKHLGTSVTRLAGRDGRDGSLSVWRLDIQLTDDETLRYVVGILQRGTAVAELGFVPAGRSTEHGDVVSIAERALQRLGELPPPS